MDDFIRLPLTSTLPVFLASRADPPVTSFQLVFRAGCAYETPDEQGYAHILEHMLLKGTEKRPGSALIGAEIDNVGASSGAFTGHEQLVLTMQTASASLAPVLDVLSDNVQHALLDPETLENEKKVILEEFEKQKNNFTRQFILASLQHLLGEHPAAQDPLGSPENIERVTASALAAYRARMITPTNAVLLAVSDIAARDMRQSLEDAFSQWHGTETAPAPAPGIIRTGDHRLTTGSNVPYWMVAYAIERVPTLEEYAGLKMLTNWLTYGYSSLLRDELRTKRGLVYTPSTYLDIHGTATVISAYTTAQKPEEAIRVTQEVIDTLKDRITDTEVARLQAQFLGIILRTSANPLNYLALGRELLRVGHAELSVAALLDAVRRIDANMLRSIVSTFLDPAQRLNIIAAK